MYLILLPIHMQYPSRSMCLFTVSVYFSCLLSTVYSRMCVCVCVCVCVYSSSRNDVPRVAQRYRTIAAHTRRRASVLVVFVVFCVQMYSFAGL